MGAWEGRRRVVILSEEQWHDLVTLCEHPTGVSQRTRKRLLALTLSARNIRVQYDPPPTKLRLVGNPPN